MVIVMRLMKWRCSLDVKYDALNIGFMIGNDQ